MNYLKTTPGIKPRKSLNRFDDTGSLQPFNYDSNTYDYNYNNDNNNNNNIKKNEAKEEKEDNTFFQVVLNRNRSSSSASNNQLSKSMYDEPKRSATLKNKPPIPTQSASTNGLDVFTRKSHNYNNESENDENKSNHFLKPPIQNRSANRQRSEDNRSSFTGSLNNSPRLDINNMVLRGIFQFEGISMDLELTNESLKLSPINDKIRSRYSNFDIDQFYGIEPIYLKPVNSSKRKNSNKDNPDELKPMCGIKLHMFENEKPNLFKYKGLQFNHPHTETCKEFIQKFTDNMSTLKHEKEVIILLNPYSGEKKTRFILNHTVAPILNTANIKHQVLEFHDRSPLGNMLISNKINLKNYHGIIIMAGDSSITRAINIIIDLEIQREENLDVFELEDIKNRIRTPFCFIPVGSTNMIANSIYGTTDYATPLRYLIHDIKMRIDMSAVFTNTDKLQALGFNYSCGFGATMLRYFKRYQKLGLNKVPTSLTRGVMKNKHRTIEVEIKFLKCKTHQPQDENLCVRGCKICNSNKIEKQDRIFEKVEDFTIPSKKSDYIREIDGEIIEHRPRKSKQNTKNREHNEENEWETIRGSFIHVACLTNATLWDQSSGGGLSKYAHLADGNIDLILVDKVSRKDFYRFIKRHTNVKNQLNLPFVKALRVKEAIITIKNADAANMKAKLASHNAISNGPVRKSIAERIKTDFGSDSEEDSEFEADENYNSNGNQMRKSNTSASLSRSRIGSIKLDSSINNGNEKGMFYIKPINKSNMTYSNKAYLNDNNDDLADEFHPNNNKNDADKKVMKKSQSIADFFKNSSSKKNKNVQESINFDQNQNEDYGQENLLYQPILSPISVNNNFTNSKSFKKPSVWNCDWFMNNYPELHIKCIRQFLPVFGHGIDPSTEFEETSVTSCLPKI